MPVLNRISDVPKSPATRPHFGLILEEFCLLATVFFLPISKAAIGIGTTLTLLFWLVRLVFSEKKTTVLNRPFVWGYGCFIAACFLSLIFAPETLWSLGLRGVLKSVQHLGFFLVCLDYCASEEKVLRLFKVFSASMVIVTLSGFYQLVTGFDFIRHSELDPGRVLRMKSCLNSPNALGAFYLFAIPAWIACVPEEKKRSLPETIFYFGILIFFATAFILTFSRAAWLGMIAATLLACILGKNWRRALLFTLSAGAIIALSKPLLMNFLSGINLQDTTVSERFRFWKYSWSMISQHPWFGIGINQFMTALPHFIPATETYRGYAHNSYLQIWAEVGTIGLICFMVPTIMGLKRGFSKQQGACSAWRGMLWIACAAFLFQAIFDNHFFAIQPAFLFWGFFGVLLANKNPEASHPQHP